MVVTKLFQLFTENNGKNGFQSNEIVAKDVKFCDDIGNSKNVILALMKLELHQHTNRDW